MKRTDILQAENDRLRAALLDILTVCGREYQSLAEWPQAVGECQGIAESALGVYDAARGAVPLALLATILHSEEYYVAQ